MQSEGQFGWKRSSRTHFCCSRQIPVYFPARWDQALSSTWAGLSPGNLTFWTLQEWAAVTVKMIHNTLKSTQPSEHSPRSTHSAAQRKLWRYSRCRGASQVESHRHSVCVLAADLNTEGGRGGGGGVMHTIHGLCHLCIGCRLPQVCFCYREWGEGREDEPGDSLWWKEGWRVAVWQSQSLISNFKISKLICKR